MHENELVKKHIVAITTMKDRIIEYVIKFCLEPVYESYASSGNFEFQSARSS